MCLNAPKILSTIQWWQFWVDMMKCFKKKNTHFDINSYSYQFMMNIFCLQHLQWAWHDVGGRLICGKCTLEPILRLKLGGRLICEIALYASIYGNFHPINQPHQVLSASYFNQSNPPSSNSHKLCIMAFFCHFRIEWLPRYFSAPFEE